MNQSVRDALIRRWARGLVSIALFLALPWIFPAVVGAVSALDPQHDRRVLAQALEREQRANGVPFVTSRGDTMRAVVFTPALPSERSEMAQQRALVWWSRLLAAVTALGLLSGTWRTLRRAPDQP